MSSLHLSMLFFSVSFKRIMFVILTQGPCSPVLVLTWRSSYADTVGEGVKKLARAQANVPSKFQSRVQHANSIRLSHTVQFPESCNSLLETAHKKKTCHLRGHAAQKKTQYVLFLYTPKSRSCHRKPLCTRAVLISVSFKSDEHQHSSSKASAIGG